MSIRQSILLSTVSSMILAAVGGLVGYLLATLAPGYYESVFPHMAPEINWVPVGIALGTTQGGIAGLLFGVILTCIFVWKEVRLESIRLGNGADT